MNKCNYQGIELIIQAHMKQNMPGVYQILQSMINPGSETMIIIALLEYPEKLAQVLKNLYDCHTARLIVRRVILEPVFSRFGIPKGLDPSKLVELLFHDPLSFANTLYGFLC
ncbi:MAG: hypothetical protein GSR77_07980 [Desulfurococcales archaeon]|nr:hypothetical protein [Desulfurococcales archaeon]